jgi:histidyl-tRNA synthetase
MSEKLQAIKGMNDLLPTELAKWHHIEAVARGVLEAFAYREIRTPVVEYTPLFVRAIGTTTDIVEKEMYTFADRDGKQLTLRPEGTASAVRAYVEHSVFAAEPVTRWYYKAPMFRHERPQKGRFRQHYQLGCEVFGVAEPTVDAEMIAMVELVLRKLGVAGVEVRVNSVGGPEDRPAYRAALVDYFRAHEAELCADCKRRLETNPLRLLDCKNESCARVAAAAPSILDYLGPAARGHFDGVRATLELLGVAAAVDTRLVRGLDYYTGTVFEVRGITSDFGAQNALCGGGRYDHLVAQLGGPPTPAMGFGMGLERLAMAVPGEPETFVRAIDLFLVSHGQAAQSAALALAQRLRAAGRGVELSHKAQSFKAQFKRADRLRARFVLILGEEELAQGAVKLRNMAGGEERLVPMGALDAELARLFG